MNQEQDCDFCGEPVGDSPVQHGHRLYCSEACAFEAQRPADCGGRTDSTMGSSTVEKDAPKPGNGS